MNILIHHNFKSASLKMKDKLLAELHLRNMEVVSESPDLIITLGGDGTMLNAIRKHHDMHVPFIGVNTGSLGFLPSVASDQISAMLDLLLEKKYTINTYPLLKIVGKTTRGESVSAYAFNEMIIKQAAPRLMQAEIFINGECFNQFAGDGIIVSTAFGSTGYSVWAGGAAVHPALGGMQIIPLCPNDNAINSPLKTPLILPDHYKMEIKINRARYASAIVGVDGTKLSKYAIAEVKVSLIKDVVKIMRLTPFDYVSLYRQKIIEKQSK